MERRGSSSTSPPPNAAPPLIPTTATGRPGGAISSSHARNQRIVAPIDSATGRPIPRLANQAYPASAAIGAHTAAYAGPVGR